VGYPDTGEIFSPSLRLWDDISQRYGEIQKAPWGAWKIMKQGVFL
jgi:hypothetical protein